MTQYPLFCAGIPITVTIQNGNYDQKFLDYFNAKPMAEPTGIRILVTIIQELPNDHNSISNKVPIVTLSNRQLTVIHPFYKGKFNLDQEAGMVLVVGFYALAAFLRLIVSVIIVERGGLAIHSSCILRNGKAHIFSGPSGYGKSTIAKLTENSLLYSDEVTFVRKDETGIFSVFHSPFRSELYTDPQKATSNILMFFIYQDSRTYLQPISQTEAIFKMLPNIFFPILARNPYEKKIFQLCCDFLEQVKPMIMHFRKNNFFWRCIDEQFGSFSTKPGHAH